MNRPQGTTLSFPSVTGAWNPLPLFNLLGVLDEVLEQDILQLGTRKENTCVTRDARTNVRKGLAPPHTH